MRRVVLTAGLLLAIAGILVGVLGSLLGEVWAWPFGWASWAPVGYLILLSRPGNRVGLASFVVGLAWAMGFVLGELSVKLESERWAAWAELGTTLAGVVPWLAIIWLLLVFPSGDYSGRAERWVTAAVITFGLTASFAFAVSSSPMEYTGYLSPLASGPLSGISEAVTSETGFLGVVVLAAAALVLLIRRGRKSEGVERAQYRWLMFGGTIFVLVMAVGQFAPDNALGQFLWIAGGSAIPTAVGVSVLRYRLYDIDRIISRTVGYAVVVALLGLVYATAAVWLPTQVIGERTPPLFVAGSTLLVVALFNPVRRWVLGWVDHRFYRSRYDAEQVASRFTDLLRHQTDVDQLAVDWANVVAEAVRPSSIGVWVRER